MRLFIYGSGEQGRVNLDIARAIKGIEIAGFIDDNPEFKGKIIDGVEVLGSLNEVSGNDFKMTIAIGDNKLRSQKASLVEDKGFELFSLIHPSSVISKEVKIAAGSVISQGAIINTGASIGKCAIINTGAIVEHDNVIEDFAQVGPGAVLAGGVIVKKGAFIGLGAKVLDDLVIGEGSVVGAGAVVTKNVEKNLVVVGIPAKPIRKKEE